MEAKFAHLDSILFGIKENLTDGQYLDVMTTVHDIYKWCESHKVAYEEDDEVGEDDRHLHIASEDEEDAVVSLRKKAQPKRPATAALAAEVQSALSPLRAYGTRRSGPLAPQSSLAAAAAAAAVPKQLRASAGWVS